MKETPLTKAVNLSARLGVDIWLKREDAQEVFSFKIRGAYNFMASLGEEERWKGVVTCSAGELTHNQSRPDRDSPRAHSSLSFSPLHQETTPRESRSPDSSSASRARS